MFTHGGWAVYVVTIIYLLYDRYLDEIQGQFLASQEWEFLSIRIPKTNTQSLVAVEQMFTQMHALATTITFPQAYIEGKFQLWYSLEMVSLGGKISYIIRTPKKQRQLVEASLYAEYPDAEISVVSDYLENLSYDPETSDFDLFGFEFKMTDDAVLPIKTFREFEHPTAEQKIIDPLKPLFEALAAIAPHELYAIQILTRPIADEDWKPQGEEKAKELLEGKKKKKARFNLLTFLAGLLPSPAKEDKKEEAKERNFMQLSDPEKEKVNGVLRKVSKPGYQTKIRHLYIAPKDKFDNGKKSLPIGAFRTLGSANTNKFKPDTKKTWTALEYKVSADLEKPYIDYIVRERKKRVFRAFKARSMYIGINPFILNVEELATIYHLPLITEDTIALPAVEAVESKKSQPPANLPVGEY